MWPQASPAISPHAQAKIGAQRALIVLALLAIEALRVLSVCANAFFDMSSSLQTASYATVWRYAIDQANDLVTKIVLVLNAPDDTAVVPTQYLAAAVLAKHHKRPTMCTATQLPIGAGSTRTPSCSRRACSSAQAIIFAG